MSAQAQEAAVRAALNAHLPGNPLSNVPRPPMTREPRSAPPPTPVAPVEPASPSETKPAEVKLPKVTERPPRPRSKTVKKPAKSEDEEAIARTRTGTLARPYERDDGVKTIKFTCTLPKTVVKAEKAHAAGLDPPWDRNLWLEYVIVTAIENHKKHGTPYPDNDFWNRKGRKG